MVLCFGSFLLQYMFSNPQIFAFEGQNIRNITFTVNVLLTCILYCDAGSGYSSERFVRVSCGMPVLFSLLVAGNSYESISRVGFINNFGSETAGLRENYLYPDNGQDYRYFLSQILGIFEASPAQIQR